MKRLVVIIFLSLIVYSISVARRPLTYSANYIGEKMWDTRKTVPYFGSVSLEIFDSIAYLKHSGNIRERVDTFIYRNIHNNCFRYTRKKYKYFYEYLLLSKDLLHLQVGEPMEVNYFYKLQSVKDFRPLDTESE